MSRTAFYSRIREITGILRKIISIRSKWAGHLNCWPPNNTLFRKLQECWDIVMLNIWKEVQRLLSCMSTYYIKSIIGKRIYSKHIFS